MGDKSHIEWTNATWNPIVGCSRVSEGCRHCYAEVMAARLANMAAAELAQGKDPGRKRYYMEVVKQDPMTGQYLPRWNGRVVLVPEALAQPLRWKRPRRIFVNSMSDLFHSGLNEEQIQLIYAVMAASPWHTYQLLTKRSDRARDWYRWHLRDGAGVARNRLGGALFFGSTIPNADHAHLYSMGDRAREAPWPLPNLHLGVSVEGPDQIHRVGHLRHCPAAIHWISAEPLLADLGQVDLTGIDWVVVGGESGAGARPMHPDWARSLRDQCQAAGVAFHFKQWGAWAPMSEVPGSDMMKWGGPGEVVRHESVGFRETGREAVAITETGVIDLQRVGKVAAGRLLDGRVWDEFPMSPGR